MEANALLQSRSKSGTRVVAWLFLVLVSVSAATAQVVMKYAAEAANAGGSIFNPRVAVIVLLSFTISCIGQLLWFYVLRFSALSTSYLFLSLVFVIVPLAAWWLFSEALHPLHFVSMALILAGVAVLGLIEQIR